MIITDILLNKKIDNTTICSSLAKIFKIKLKDICLIEKIEDMPDKNQFEIVCLVNKFNEGIPILLSIYGFEKQYKQKLLLELLLQFAGILNFSCFIPSDVENPFELLQLNPDKTTKKVFYDSETYDEKGIYILK